MVNAEITQNARLCLASASPRRAELLASIGVYPESIVSADIDESSRQDEIPASYVARMAYEKAQAVKLHSVDASNQWVLGADTAVIHGSTIMGKPKDFNDFCRMFGRLSGAQHTVISAVSLLGADDSHLNCVVTSTVQFRSISNVERDAYWATGEPCDKAGGYAIQGLGAQFVESISGSYSGIVGLPLFETAKLLTQAGWNMLGINREGASSLDR